MQPETRPVLSRRKCLENDIRFVKGWLRRPRSTGSITPTGKAARRGVGKRTDIALLDLSQENLISNSRPTDKHPA